MRYLRAIRDELQHLLWKYQEDVLLIGAIIAGIAIVVF